MTDSNESAAAVASRASTGFEIDEIFFSRTDERGVIASGNEVFQRISGFEWSELINAPHKLVRHQDMPKSVFHLFWARLKENRPVIAYVKNRTKTNGHYWVIAFVLPLDDGYLSVRIKPTSKRFDQVESLYASIRSREEKGWSAEENGHDFLMEALEQHGFGSYDEFAARSAVQEVAARDKAIGASADTFPEKLLGVHEAAGRMIEDAEALSETFLRMRTTPINMGIMASRIERAGGPISAISGLYSAMSNEIGAWVTNFLSDSDSTFGRMERASLECISIILTTKLLEEMCVKFAMEAHDEASPDREQEIDRLRKEASRISQVADEALARTRKDARAVNQAVHILKRHVMSLSSTRVICEIESAKLSVRSQSLEGVVAQLGAFQKEIEERHQSIEAATQSVLAILADEEPGLDVSGPSSEGERSAARTAAVDRDLEALDRDLEADEAVKREAESVA